jgi:hypothetical protein
MLLAYSISRRHFARSLMLHCPQPFDVYAAYHARRSLCAKMPGMNDFCALVPDAKIFTYHLCLPSISTDISEGIVKTCACGKIYKAHVYLRNHHLSHTKFHQQSIRCFMMQLTKTILSAICVVTLVQAAPQSGLLDKSKSCGTKGEVGSDIDLAIPASLTDIANTTESKASATQPYVYYGVSPYYRTSPSGAPVSVCLEY